MATNYLLVASRTLSKPRLNGVLHVVALGMACCLLTACDSSDVGDGDTGGLDALPRYFRLTGEASGSNEDGETATCTMDLSFQLDEEVSRSATTVVYRGRAGGEVIRTVVDRDGNGIQLLPFLFWEMETTLSRPDRFEILSLTPITPEDGRFYQELALISGTVDLDSTGTGSWTCAPFDISSGGYVDTALSVPGTFAFQRLSRSPFEG